MERNARRNLLPLMLPLASLGLLTGCAQTQPFALIATDSLCKSWRHQTIKSGDKMDEATASQIEGNNRARPAWGCKYGRNESTS